MIRYLVGLIDFVLMFGGIFTLKTPPLTYNPHFLIRCLLMLLGFCLVAAAVVVGQYRKGKESNHESRE